MALVPPKTAPAATTAMVMSGAVARLADHHRGFGANESLGENIKKLLKRSRAATWGEAGYLPMGDWPQ
jgi:hypothetical protein